MFASCRDAPRSKSIAREESLMSCSSRLRNDSIARSVERPSRDRMKTDRSIASPLVAIVAFMALARRSMHRARRHARVMLASRARRACRGEPISRHCESCCIVINSFFSISYAMKADRRSQSQRGSTSAACDRASMKLRAAVRSDRNRRAARLAQTIVDDLSSTCLPMPSHRADGSFKTELMTRTFMTSRSRADRLRKTIARPLESMA